MAAARRNKKKKSLRLPVRPAFGFQEISSFLNLSREILQATNLNRVFQQAVQKIPLFLKADSGILHLLDEKGENLQVVKKYRVGRVFSIPLTPGEGIASRILRRKKALAIPNLAKNSSFWLPGKAKKQGFLSAMCAPLWAQGKALGILTIFSRKARPYGNNEALLLSALTDQVATAMAKAGYGKKTKKEDGIAHLRGTSEKGKNFWEEIMEGALDPILVTDLHGRITFASQGAEETFGQSRKRLLGKRISDFYAGGEQVAKKITKILLKKEKLENYEIELFREGAKPLSVLLSASLLRDARGTPVGTWGVGKDITEYKKLFSPSLQGEERYKKLFEAVNDAIFSLNRGGYFNTFNRMFLKMTGYTETEIKNFHFSRILHPDDLSFLMNDYQKVMRGEYAPERYTFRLINKEERVIYVEGNFRRLKEKNEVVGVLGVLRDVTEKIKLERELLELSITDGLTGLHNQRHFFKELDKEMERARRQRISLSLLLFDLDDFKAFNDLHGHLEGDKVLKSVAQAVIRSIRKMDSAFRYGGDEFTVILPGAGKAEGTKVAERIIKSFKTAPYLEQINLSIGLVELDPKYDLTAFIQHADQAMYTAKKMGGNQIFVVT